MDQQTNAPNAPVVVDVEATRREKIREYNREYKRKRNAMKPKNRKGPEPKPETTARMSEGAPNSHAARQRNYRERLKQRLATHAQDDAPQADIAPPEAEIANATQPVATDVAAEIADATHPVVHDVIAISEEAVQATSGITPMTETAVQTTPTEYATSDVSVQADILAPKVADAFTEMCFTEAVVATELVEDPTVEQTQPPTLPAFSLLAELHVPVSVTAKTVFSLSEQRRENPAEHKPVFDENPPLPVQRCAPRIKLAPEMLLQKTPIVTVSSATEANGEQLNDYCCAQDIVVVRGMLDAVGIDVNVFSTQRLIQDAPDFKIVTLEQPYVPGDDNIDDLARPTWKFTRSKGWSTIATYGSKQLAYISASGNEPSEPAVKKTKAHKSSGVVASSVEFATNIDLVDKALFSAQIQELYKMPAFCALKSDSDLLRYLDFDILGMSQAQLYMKMPGCRTPGHLENNCLASINVNIGPGDCEWFAVAYEHWPAIDDLCKRKGLDFFRSSWWPSIDDLTEAGIPYHKFTQQPGDLVWVGYGCVHWVQSTGATNNVAWNVGPIDAAQLRIAMFSYEWNRAIQYRSLVPLQHLSWQLARAVHVNDEETFKLVKGILVRSLAYCRIVAGYVHAKSKCSIVMQPRDEGEVAPYCRRCKAEVFNVLFTKKNKSGKYDVYCAQCACRSSINDYSILQQYSFEDLASVFDLFKL